MSLSSTCLAQDDELTIRNALPNASLIHRPNGNVGNLQLLTTKERRLMLITGAGETSFLDDWMRVSDSPMNLNIFVFLAICHWTQTN